MLKHSRIVGTLELSTAYTWTAAEESLKVCTSKGIYCLSQMDELTFTPKPYSIFGVPFEKVRPYNKTAESLYSRNNFTPTLLNNPIYSQGYFNEIEAFINAVEGREAPLLTSLEKTKETMSLFL